jgi:hypothetical protein
MTAKPTVGNSRTPSGPPQVVDPFPIRAAPYAQITEVLAELQGRQLSRPPKCDSFIELARLLADGSKSDALSIALREALENHEPYIDWKRRMPFLKDVPELRRYRNQHGKHDPMLVYQAIDQHGLTLPEGQMLFHGGQWPRRPAIVGQTYHTIDVLSTSLCPDVASVHARPDGELWALRVGQGGSKARAFVFNSRGNQNLKHEYEVVLAPGATLRCTGIEHGKKLCLIELDLS